jgi:ribosome-associated toxin RatA of RatAB toxin-antitoxin module
MPQYQVTQRIKAPAAVVWEDLSDVLAWPEWLPTVTAISPIEGKAFQLGASFKVIQPRLRPAVWQVTELEPGRCFIWESRSPGAQLWAAHKVWAVGTNESEVELQFRISGTLGMIFGWLAGSLARSYLSLEADSLKQRAESRTSGGG